jgi:hypothetical protein
MKGPNRTQDREAARHTAAILKLQRLEARMVRAQRAWDKAREVVRRYDVKADKRFGTIGGQYDVRDMAEGAGIAPFAHPSRRSIFDDGHGGTP